MPHRLHIPRIGETIELAESWTFTLHEERRNEKLIKMVDPNYQSPGWSRPANPQTWTVTLPADWELRVDRIYIRNGQSRFDSVTFSCPYNGKKVRFWARLSDVNKMVIKESE